MDTKDILKMSAPTVAVAGLAYWFGQMKLKNLLSKSLVIRVADNAPAAVKLALANLHMSVKLQDVYNSIDNPGASPVTQYLKITLE